MNLKHLPYFLAIAETGSLSSAAVKLKISQPALSKYLSGLESELKIELFTRNKKKLNLTAAGRVYYEASWRILEVQNQTLDHIGQLYSAVETISIGASGTRGAVMIAKAYSMFVRRYPMFRLSILELTSAQQREAVLSGRISMSFGGYFTMNMPGLRYIPFMAEELVLAVPVFHPLAHLAAKNPENLTSIDISKFRDSPFALASEMSELGQASKKLFINAGFIPTVVYRSGITSMISSAVKAGMGIGVILASYAESCSELVYFKIISSPNMYLCAVHRSAYTLGEAERYLLYLQIILSEEKAGYKPDINDQAKAILAEFGPNNMNSPIAGE